MGGMKSSDGPVVLDTQIEIAAVGVRQADDGRDQVAVVQPVAIALEFDRQAFSLGDVGCHRTGPLRATVAHGRHTHPELVVAQIASWLARLSLHNPPRPKRVLAGEYADQLTVNLILGPKCLRRASRRYHA